MLRAIAFLLSVTLLQLLAATAEAGDLRATLKYVPNDAFAVVGVHLDALRKSPAFAPLSGMVLHEARADKALAKLKTETGFDPVRDVKSVVVAFGADFVTDDDQFLIVVEATVDEAKLVAFLKKQQSGLRTMSGPGGKHYLLGRRGDAILAFRGAHVILGGAKVVRSVLGGKRGNAKVLAGSKLTSQDAFVIGNVPVKLQGELGKHHQEAGSLQHVALGLALGLGLDGRATLKLKTATEAQALAKRLNKLLGEAAADKDLKKVGLDAYLGRLKATATGREVTLKLSLSKADLQVVVDKLKKLMDRSSAPNDKP